MVKRSAQAEAAQEVKRLTDYVQQGRQFEGEKVKFDEVLLGHEFKLLDFALLNSKQQPEQAPAPGEEPKPKKFLVLQVEYKGTTYVTSCGAAQVVDAVSQLPKQYLPVLLRVVKEKNPKTGRNFYRVE